jgi:hypothetical protein
MVEQLLAVCCWGSHVCWDEELRGEEDKIKSLRWKRGREIETKGNEGICLSWKRGKEVLS